MWMHEHYMWGFWWVFPLLGLGLLIALIILVARLIGGKGVCSSSKKDEEIEELRKQVQELKDELEKFRKKE